MAGAAGLSPANTGPATATALTLAARLDTLIAPVAAQAAVGVCVCSLDQGDELYARNADAAFVPASNQKLLIAAAALDALGPDFCFTTRLLLLGPRHGATLDGDLILRGGGDPTLTTAGLAALADRVAALGLRRVTGRVRADDSVFDRERLGSGWSWDDEPYAYAAPISGLTVNKNSVGVEVRPAARPGLPLKVRLDPPAAPMNVTVRAVTAPAGEAGSLSITRTRAQDEIRVTGRLPLDGEPVVTRVTVENPPLYAATVLAALLKARGVRVSHPAVGLGTPVGAVLLGEEKSPPLAAIIREMNKTSDNLIAETLLKRLGVEAAGEGTPASISGSPRSSTRMAAPTVTLPGVGIGGRGERVLRAFLTRAGLRGPALVIADGCGLSRLNLVSPRNLVALLAAMDRHPARAAFFDSLPIAGVDGTLRRRMGGTAAAGAVRAKTGTLTHVTALSGIVTTRSGERLAFSVLTNNFPGALTAPGGPRPMEDAIAAALAEYLR